MRSSRKRSCEYKIDHDVASRRTMIIRKLTKCLLLLCLVSVLGAAPREKRVALVIGNGAYQQMTRLNNPPQDAQDVGRKLESLGFEVTTLENQGRAAMELAVEEFAKRSQGAKVAVLYYSGHGIQIDGRNYLIPVDAEPPDDEAGMHRQALELEWLVGRTTRAAQVSLIFMDACRNNPGLYSRMPGTLRDVDREVRLVNVPKGTVQVLYAASRGQKARDYVGPDNRKSRNSPFAEALLEHLGDRDSVQNVSTRIIQQVKRRTESQQQPEQQGNLDELLYLSGRSTPVTCPAGTILTDGACLPVVHKTCPAGMKFEDGVGCMPVVEELPETLERAVIMTTLKRVDLSPCKAGGASGVITVKITIARSGSVSDTSGTNDCVNRIFKGVKFPAFRGDPMSLTYPALIR